MIPLEMISLDGSMLEGGGQLIRTALALSTLTGQPFEAWNIRAGRKKPGLKAQHLHCIKALSKLCGAQVKHAELGSEKLEYKPGKISGGKIKADIGTAGSVSLLLQGLLLPALFAPKKVTLEITGGTTGKWAMPYDFFKEVFVPHIRRFVKNIDSKLIRRGYYPKGGGEINIGVVPKYSISNYSDTSEFLAAVRSGIAPISLKEQGQLVHVKGISHAHAELENANVAERQARAAKIKIANTLGCPVSVRCEYANTHSIGSGITLWAVFSREEDEVDVLNPIILGSDSLGEKGKRAEAVGEEAALQLIREVESGAACDSHLLDNLIPFMALVPGSIVKTSEITGHTRTNIWVCEQFLDVKFRIDEDKKIVYMKAQGEKGLSFSCRDESPFSIFFGFQMSSAFL